jgi:hypothetical protein
MYALPTYVLETLSVNEVDPILRTFVEIGLAAIDLGELKIGNNPKIEMAFNKERRLKLVNVRPSEQLCICGQVANSYAQNLSRGLPENIQQLPVLERP